MAKSLAEIYHSDLEPLGAVHSGETLHCKGLLLTVLPLKCKLAVARAPGRMDALHAQAELTHDFFESVIVTEVAVLTLIR